MITRLLMVAPKVFQRNSVLGARSGGLPRRKFTLALLLYHSGHFAARMSHRHTRSGCAAIAISLRAYTDELSGSNPAGHFIGLSLPYIARYFTGEEAGRLAAGS